MTEPIKDGIYIDLPMRDYVRDPAISGSKLYLALTDPGAIQWDSPANPLRDPDEEEKSTKGQMRGSAAHAAILEGIDAYEARYAKAPTGALRTGDDMSAWIRKAKETWPHCASMKISGSVGELRARIIEARELIPEDEQPRFVDELLAGRQVVSDEDDTYVRLIERFVRRDGAVAPFISNGLPELSIFWTEHGTRFKMRADYLNAHGVLDVKTYARAPGLDRDLKKHLAHIAWYEGYCLQAIHNARGAAFAGEAYLANELHVVGASETQRALLTHIFEAHQQEPPVFRWLFLRMGGALRSLVLPFRESDQVYQAGALDVADAIETIQHYRKTCGADQLWHVSGGEQEIEDSDWPFIAGTVVR